jgi:hypothetical protein
MYKSQEKYWDYQIFLDKVSPFDYKNSAVLRFLSGGKIMRIDGGEFTTVPFPGTFPDCRFVKLPENLNPEPNLHKLSRRGKK